MSEMFTSGDLDHRLTLLQQVEGAADNYGAPTITYEETATVFAKRIDASAGERYRAREVNAEITAHFIVRYSQETSAVDPKYRVRLEDGLTYEVTGTRELQRNRWIEIHAVARAD